VITNAQSFFQLVYGHTMFIDGGNLVMPDLLNQPTTFFVVDPTTMNRNSTGLNLETGTVFNGNIILANPTKYLDSAWTANGWDHSIWDRHMSSLVGRNITLVAPNKYQIKNIIRIRGTIGGQSYTIGLIQHGNQGIFTLPGIVTGINGALSIANGQTVNILEGGTYQYSSINIAAGGTLQIIGTAGGWTEIGCQGNCAINGTIIVRAGLEGESTSGVGTFTKTSAFEIGTLSYTLAQAAGGAGGAGGGGAGFKAPPNTNFGGGGAQSAGNGGGGGIGAANGVSPGSPGGGGGAKGNHGKGLHLYVEGTLSGTGSINASARAGYNGGSGGGGNGGGGGGGGGGSGGRIVVRYAALAQMPALSVAAGGAGIGGAGGTGWDTYPTVGGSNGAAGSVGSTNTAVIP
jgi:hypothetical protein